MSHILELSLREVRGAVPAVWLVAQILAALSSLAYTWFRARPRAVIAACLAGSLPAGALGALALGMLYRLFDRLSGRNVDLWGVAAYGALIGVCVAFSLLVRRRDLPVLPSLDAIAPGLAILVGVGRLGCFFGGCDAGQVSASALSVRFPAGTAVFRDHVARGLVLESDRWSLAVHPTQLYEAGIAFALAWIGERLTRTERSFPGLAFCTVALGYTLARAFADSLRQPGTASLYGAVTSFALAPGVILLLWMAASRHRRVYAPQ